MTVEPSQIENALGLIEEEMRRLNLWSSEPSLPDGVVPQAPFGHGQMSFEQWLQFVLIPNARKLASSGGPFPPDSQVAAQAAREFNYHDDFQGLIRTLSDFDTLFK